MMLFHPLGQSVAIILLLYVFWLGCQRFAFQHLGMKRAFNWKRHVLLGKITCLLMIGGTLGGVIMTRMLLNSNFVTGKHAPCGILISSVLVVLFMTGYLMDSRKKKRKFLPLAHAALGIITVLLSIYQVWSGLWVLNTYNIYKFF